MTEKKNKGMEFKTPNKGEKMSSFLGSKDSQDSEEVDLSHKTPEKTPDGLYKKRTGK